MDSVSSPKQMKTRSKIKITASRVTPPVQSTTATTTGPRSTPVQSATITDHKTNKFFGAMKYSTTKCEHTNAIGTDLRTMYLTFHDANFFENNKKKFNNGVPLAAVQDSARQLAATMIKSFLDVTFENYYQQLMTKEYAIKNVEHYDLFTIAAYNTIYAHTTAFYGLEDLFKDHRNFVKQFVGKFGGSFEPQISSRKNMYDNIIMDAMNNARQGQKSKSKLVDHLCDLFQTSFNQSILPDIAVIRSIYIYRYLGQIDNNFDYHYMNENLKKSGCGFKNHNGLFTMFNQKLPANVLPIKMDLSSYHRKRLPPPRYNHPAMIQHVNHQRFGCETDSMFQAQDSRSKVLSHLEKKKNDEKPSLQAHLLMVNIWKHQETERLRKMGVAIKVKSLQDICRDKLSTFGGHDIGYLQPQAKLNHNYIRSPIQFDIMGSEFYSRSIWCQATDLRVRFEDGMNFVLFCRHPPKLDHVHVKYHRRYVGEYAIIAYDKKVWIYNNKYHPNYFVHRKSYDIILNDHNFMIWSQNLFPTYMAPYLKSHTLLHFGNDEGYNNILRGIECSFIQIGFGLSTYLALCGMVDDYYWFGY